MKWVILFLITSASAVILWMDYSHQSRSPLTEKQVLQAVPNFAFRSLNHEAELDLAQLKGKTVLVNFWASWCVPCVHEFPMLVEFANQHAEDVVLLLVSVDHKPEDAAGFAKKYKAWKPKNIHIIWDEKKAISQDIFGTVRYPETLWVTPDGMIQEKIIGVVDEEKLAEITSSLTTN